MAKQTFWTVLRPNGKPVSWLGARRTRAEVMDEAAMGCMGCREYDELGTRSARWAHLYRRGFRLERVRLVPLAAAKGESNG